jgi:hypothetical protein
LVRPPRRYGDPVTIWFMPVAIVAIGSVLVALRAWTVRNEAQALARSLVALRTLTPDFRALAEERAALAARLNGIGRHPLVSPAHRR